jgi:DNA invertase Pin-like site-specific DNA recombinase
VTRIDRLARSIGDLQDIVRTVRERGASLKATEQPIDTGTAAGKCFLDMLGVFAEFETNLRLSFSFFDLSGKVYLPFVGDRDLVRSSYALKV